jgi:hypothetical protein
MEKTNAERLAQIVRTKMSPFDTVFSPPSRRADADVYRGAILADSRALDLSSRFSRKSKIKAATAETLNDLFGEFEYTAAGDEAKIKSLLVVDESFASGRTVATCLRLLRQAGLSTDCTVRAAVAALLSEHH